MARRVKTEKTENSSPLTIYGDDGGILASYPAELVNTIKSTVAKGATDEELIMFLTIAKQYDLNPFMKEIWFTKMKDEVAIMTSRDGYKKLAEREPTFRKCQSWAVFENDDFEMSLKMGEIVDLVHKFRHTDRGRIIGAYAVLKTTNHDNLATYVDFKEYDKRNNIWKKYPSAMIRKVAENDVYKRFARTNGLNDYESMPTRYYSDVVDEEMAEMEEIDIQDVIDTTIEEIENGDD